MKKKKIVPLITVGTDYDEDWMEEVVISEIMIDGVWYPLKYLCWEKGGAKNSTDISIPELEQFIRETKRLAERNGCKFVQPSDDIKELFDFLEEKERRSGSMDSDELMVGMKNARAT